MKPGDSVVQSAKYLNVGTCPTWNITQEQARHFCDRRRRKPLIDIIEGNRADDRPLYIMRKSQLVVRASTARLEA